MTHGARPMRSTRRLANIQSTLPRWYSITNSAAAGMPTIVSIYDEIGFFGVSAADFQADLRAIQGDIEMHINSPGGDIFDGIAIYNQLRQRAGSVHVIVDSLAASAASFIAQAASPGMLEMAPHAQMMIHDGFAMSIGNAADLRETADLLDKASDNIAGIYADRTGKPAAYWREKMQAELWLSDEEAVAEGLADRVQGKEPVAKNDWDLSVFARYAGVPVNVAPAPKAPAPKPVPAVKDAAGEEYRPQPYRREPDETVECPSCHKYNDTDAAFCDQCGAKLTGRDDVVQQSAPADMAKAVRAVIINADVDTSDWNAAKAWAAGAESGDPEAFYRGICAGRKAGDPTIQAAWALPYKYSPSSKPNASGVRNALARLPQTKGLTNASEARSVLEKAMKLASPDWEPDDHIDTGLLSASLLSLLKEG